MQAYSQKHNQVVQSLNSFLHLWWWNAGTQSKLPPNKKLNHLSVIIKEKTVFSLQTLHHICKIDCKYHKWTIIPPDVCYKNCTIRWETQSLYHLIVFVTVDACIPPSEAKKTVQPLYHLIVLLTVCLHSTIRDEKTVQRLYHLIVLLTVCLHSTIRDEKTVQQLYHLIVFLTVCLHSTIRAKAFKPCNSGLLWATETLRYILEMAD